MCPQFNLVLEETPRKFLHRQRKTSLGVECCQNQLIRQSEGRTSETSVSDLSVPSTVLPLSFAAMRNLFSIINCLVAGRWMQTEEGFVHFRVFLMDHK